MEKSSQMLASPPNHTSPGLATNQWGPQHPTVLGEVGVVTSSQSEIKDLIGLFFMVTLNLIALLANTGIMVAIARAPHLKRFAFVCHLSAVDMLCAILLMPLGILSSSPYFSTTVFTVLECQVYIFLNVFLICASILTITAISVERYYYIIHPMRYEMRMSINLAMGVMVLIWVKSILLALVPVVGWPAYGPQSSIAASHCSLHWSHSRLRRVFAVLFSVVCFLVPALIIFTVYSSVYRVARSAALQQAPASAWTTSSLGNPTKRRSDSINSQTTIITTGRNLPQRLSPERAFSGGKAALTLVVIVGQFLLCWLPYFIFHLHLSLGASRQSPGDVEETVTWLAYSSFAVNPFFYGMLNRQIREELVKFRRCCGSERPVEPQHGPCGSLQETFLKFLQRSGSGPRSSLEQGSRTSGQIPEEHG